ncbi:MAG: MFS transporter [Promethearchaeota archaeon]
MQEKFEEEAFNYTTPIHVSYALGSFLDDFIATVLSTWVFKFYETEIFLPVAFISTAIIIYGIWNAVNDPLAGHVSGKSFNFMRRFGRRFSWFILAAIPCTLVYALIYLPPGNGIEGFAWLLFTLCLFDTLFSFALINWQGIFPDKFRSQKERTKVAGTQILCSLTGLLLGILVPLLLISRGPPGTNVASYVEVALFVSITCLIVVFFMIPGMREDEQMIKRTLFIRESRAQRDKYWRKLVFGLKQKNYIAYLFAYLAQTTVMALMLASVPYWLQYVVKVNDPFAETALLLVFLLAAVSSSPLWVKVARKYGNRVGYMCGTGGTALFLIITMFIRDFTFTFIGMALIGFSMGATWTLIYACFSDVIDDIVVKTGKRDEGVYYGFRTFFGRMSIVIQAVTFGIIHPLTNFDPTSLIQTSQAQWGINFGMFAVPAFFYSIGFLFMWRVYELKPEIVKKNKQRLLELNL